MSPSSFLRRAAARWQIRTSPSSRDRYSEDGDTLVEVLAALVVLGIAAMALLFGFATSINASAEHRNLASLDSSVRIAANQAIADVQQEAGDAANNPFLCPATSWAPTFDNLTGSYTVTPARAWWNGSTFQSATCEQYQPQEYTLTVSSGSYSAVVTTVISDPSAPPSPNGVGVPSKLVWLQQPSSGTVGTPVNPQPEVAIEDTGNNIVSSDLAVTLQLVAPAPGHLSTTCSGVESYGIVQFSDCSLSAVGTYGIKAVATNSSVAATPTASVTVTTAPPAKFVFTSTAVSGTASNTATLGLITVTEEDAFNNPTNVPETINLSSSSTKGVFSLTSGGTATTQVGISGGASSVSFYYGDTVAGSPTIQAASPVGPGALASGQQVESIKAGTAAQLAFTSTAFSAGSSNFVTNPFTVSLEDTYNNVTTKTTSTTVTLSSNSGTGKFAATSGGTATTSVSILANQSSVTAYYGDPTVGTPTITASSSPLTSGSQIETITVAPTKLVFTTSTVSGNAAKNASLGPITVTEEASNGALTTVGMTVNLSSSSTGTSIFNTTSGATTPTGATTVTIPNGQSSVTFYYGDTKAGSPTITAAATGLTSTTQTETVTVGPIASFVVTPPGTQTAGTAFSETITAVDAGGNTVTGYSGANCLTFSGPANSPNGTVPAYPAPGGSCAAGSSSLTFASGTVTTSITLYDAQTTTALAVVDGLITGNSGNFAVNAGATTRFALSTPSPAAGTAFNETITATDNYGNTTTGYAGNKCITFSGPSNSPNNTPPHYPGNGGGFGGCGTGSQVAFTNGTATPSITLYDAQTTTLTATATGAVGTSASFAVSSGPMKTLTVANPGTQAAGVPFNVALTGTDTYGNNASGTFSPTFSGPANSPNGTAPIYPGSVTFTNGAATANVTLYDAQSTTLKVTEGAVSGTSTAFTVNAGPTTVFNLSTPTPVAGTAFTETITTGDAYGNSGSSSFTGQQCITFSGPANSPNGTAPTYPAQGTCAAGQSSVTFSTGGVGTASITLYNAGSTTLTATQSLLTGSVTFTVSSGSVKTLTIPTTPTTQTAGAAFNVTVDATDNYGNPYSSATAVPVTFSGPANSPAPANTPPTYPASITFTNGVGTANITLFDAQNTTLTVASAGATSGVSGTFTVSPSTLGSFTVPTPSTQTAGTSFNETITALDAYDNPASGWTSGTECVTFSGPSSSPSPVTAPLYPVPTASCSTGQSGLTFNASGQATAAITLYDVQSTTLRVTSNSAVAGKTGVSGTFAVSSGSLSSFTVPTPSTQTAGTSFNETITALDAYGNPANGWTSGTKCVTFSGPSSSPSPVTAPLYPVPTASCTTGQSGLTFNASGQATAAITLYDVQPTTLTVTSNSAVAGKTGTSGTFTVSSGSVKTLTIPTTPTTQTAGAAFNVTVDATDNYGNPYSSATAVPVTFSGPANSPAPANTPPTYPASITFTNGVGTANITLFDAQNTTLTVASAGATSGVSGTFTVSPSTLGSFTVPTPSTQTAGTSFNETITALDAYDNPASGWTSGTECVTFSGPSSSPSPVTAPLYPVPTASCSTGQSGLTFNASGQATAAITLYDVQSTTLRVTSNSAVAGKTGVSGTFAVSSGSLSSFTVPTPSTQTAGTSFNETITALDAYGNPANGWTSGTKCVTFSGPSSSPSPVTAPLYPVPTASCTTGQSGLTFNASGQATAAITLYDVQPTTLTVTSNSAVAGKTGTSGTFAVSSGSVKTLTIPTTPTTQTAGAAFNVTVDATDNYGNPYSSATAVPVTFSGPANSPAPANTPPTYPASITFTNGVGTANITLFDAQNTTLTVASAGATSGVSGTFTVSPSTLGSFTVPTPSTQTAGTSFNETITALDAYDNPASGWTSGTECVTFSGPSSSPSPVTAPLYPVPTASCSTGQSGLTFNASGQATAAITLYDVQSTTLRVTSNSAVAGKTGTSGTFAVSSGSVKTLTIPTTPTTQTAGAAFNVTVDATDNYGNPYSSATAVPVTFSGPANSPAPANTPPTYPASITFTNGVGTANITLFDAQNTTLTVASAGATSGITPASFTVSPTTLGSFTVPTPSTQTAGTSFNETITALDAYGNPGASGWTSGTKCVTFSGPSSSPSPVTAPLYPVPTASCSTGQSGLTFNASGQATAAITLYDAQSPTLTVTSNSAVAGKTGASGAFLVSPSTLGSFTVPTPSTQTAGTSFNETITALDAYGNPGPNGWTSGTECVTFSGPSSSPSPVTAPLYPVPTASCTTGQSGLTFNASGQATAAITLYDVQSTTLRVTSNSAVAGKTGTSGTFAVSSGSVKTLTIPTTPTTQTAGAAFNVTVDATDNYGNPYSSATAVPVTFSGPANSPAPANTPPTYPASITFTNGVGTANITLFDAQNTTLTVASAGATSGITPASFTVSPTTLGSFTVPTPSTQTAGTSFNETITALDAYGNPGASGWTSGTKCVTFSGPSSSPSPVTAPLYPVPTASCSTGQSGLTFNASGQATAAITLYDAQSPTLTVTSNSAVAGKTGASGAFLVSPSTLGSFTVPTPSTQTAGTSFNETITALDAYGNPGPNGWTSGTECVTFSGPSSSPSPVTAPLYPVPTASCTTGQSGLTFNASGQATAAITLYDVQSTTLRVTSNSAVAGKTGTSGTFAVSSGSVKTLTIPTTPTTQTAGAAFNVTVDATDNYGNPYSSATAVPVTFSGPANSPAPANTPPTYPASITFTNGVGTANITLFDAQNTTLTVASAGATSGVSGTFTVSPAGAHSFTLSTPTPTAGTSFNETITAFDTYDNAASGFTAAQCIAFSGPTNSPAPSNTPPAYPVRGTCATGQSSVTFNASGVGTASITLSDAVSTTLTATQGTITGSATFTVSPAGAHSFTLSTPTPTAGTAFTETITALDTYDNSGASGFTGAQCIAFSGPTNSPAPSNTPPAYPVRGTCATGQSSVTFDASGVGTASITLSRAGSTTLTATQGTITGSATFTVSSGSVKTLTIPTTPATQTAGSAFNVTVDATDTYSNPYSSATAVPVTFSGPANSPAPANTPPTYPASITFTNGVGTANITLFDAQNTTLTVASAGATSGVSGTFTVSSAAAHALTATSGAGQTAATINSAFANPLVATVTDLYDNGVSGVTVTFTAPGGGNAPSATFATSCVSNPPPNGRTCGQTTGATGQATSSTFTANGHNGTYNLTAASAGLTSVTYSETN